MAIRPFDGTLADAQALVDIDHQTFDDCPYTPSEIRTRLADPRQQVWVAVEEDQVVGLVAAFDTHSLAGDRWEIDELAVRPAFQGRGWGTRLVAQALAYAPGGVARQARTIVATRNTPSQRAFARNGFAPAIQARLLSFDVVGRVPRPLPAGLSIGRAGAPLVAQCSGGDPQRVARLVARADTVYLAAWREGACLGCVELIEVHTLQYTGLWLESLWPAVRDRRTMQILFAAAIEETKSRPQMDRVGYLAPLSDPLQHAAAASEGFVYAGDYHILTRELSA